MRPAKMSVALARAPAPPSAAVLAVLNSSVCHLARSRRGTEALRLFAEIESRHGLTPDHYSLVGALSACANLRARAAGLQLHARAVRSGLLSYIHVANSIITFYASTGRPECVHHLFDEIPEPDVYSRTTLLSAYAKAGRISRALRLFGQMHHREVPLWNALITGSAEHGHRDLVLQLFHRMRDMGVDHDHYTLASILSLCGSPEFLDLGRQVHTLAAKTGFLMSKASAVNALLTMYFDGGRISDALDLFGETSLRNEVTFNSVIAGLARSGGEDKALSVLKEMMKEAGLRPTELTLVSVLSVCSSKEIGGQVHALSVKMALDASTLVGNATVTMYSNWGDLQNAFLVFDKIRVKDCVSWNAMISVYSQHSCHEPLVDAFWQMQMLGYKPDEFTYGSLLAFSKFIEHTDMILAQVKKNGLIISIYVSNSLIVAYAKHGDIRGAYRIFCNMVTKSLISWNSILSGCLLNGYPRDSLELFIDMIKSEITPNTYTLSIVLSTCASISSLKYGEQVHAYILKSCFHSEISLANALITMYAKCGEVDHSFKIFSRMLEKNIISWNSMLAAYAQNGYGKEAIDCFKMMQDSGVDPDNVTFTSVLSGCSHAGLVNEAHWIFSSMTGKYGIQPAADHYSCVIDLLGRAGRLDEAEKLISSMPYKLDSKVWWALLSSCSSYGHARLGRTAANFLLEKEPGSSAVYVLLSNIRATAGEWGNAYSMRELMRTNGIMKQPGHSWLELT